MSVLAHLLRPAAGARRAYSVFSKGGGYFNSSKSPKVVPASSKAKKVDTSSPSSTDSTSASSTNPSSPKEDPNASSSSTVAAAPDPRPLVHPSPVGPPPAYAYNPALQVHSPVHPRPSAADLRMHQFFSLGRPLLALGQPPAALFEAHASPFPPPAPTPPGLDSFAATVSLTQAEADAEAARQLARALVVQRVGASLDWDAALGRLGLDVDAAGRAAEVHEAEEAFQVYMDSTKRKRRKKMKKHK
ncbi:uncharacterized protein BXZ73DRAFT_95382 [Epithele typhae]|uniref:uncharacterized protein n=1 Tax=Epithele typhae TaxID=378194 RepID=UPI002007EA9E|nr:uncharacterized protein BXZ73DRAFT_95382 [Epithele typhae]KAH9945862.1 hypothetical protein BXZ73DRAFT_95382 [Epithele typhae]